jgi:hypothetical protein
MTYGSTVWDKYGTESYQRRTPSAKADAYQNNFDNKQDLFDSMVNCLHGGEI